jgi:predicted DCC family thiol-disulfide oxidoreductase YuxK
MNVIFFDGVCKLCDSLVNFIIDHDKTNEFKFAAIQSDLAKMKLVQYKYDPKNLDTFYLLENYNQPGEKIYMKSTAGLRIFKQLGGFFGFLASIGLVFPSFIRDIFYKIIAKTRYKIFGKYKTCKIPSPQIIDKFIDHYENK